MNELEKALYNAPSIDTAWCPFCGFPAQNKHHIVPRSRGGTHGATVNVCGMGNASGCHGLLHAHKLHMKYENGTWYYLRTSEPTKYQTALQMEGWKELGNWN